MSAAALQRSVWESPSENSAPTYFDHQFKAQALKILPGDYHVTKEDLMLVTVLGSCVSACIRDSGAGVGGMNHFMLPESELAGGATNSARYGSFAMEVLLNELFKQGARRSCLEAKVFGGGNVLRGFTANQVGTRNAEFVRSYLEAERIPISAEDLGDIHPRKIYYFPKTGRVMVRKLNAVQSTVDLSDESAYRKRLDTQNTAGDVELFD